MIYNSTLNDMARPPFELRPDDRAKRVASLDAEILRVAGLSNAIEYQFINLLAEFDELEGWAGDGVKSFAHWLNWRCGMGAVVAREKVRVARKLRDLPRIDAAFRDGEVCYTQVRAMTRVATAETEEYLLFIAKQGTARHIEQAVRRYDWCKHRDAYESGELDEYRTTPRLNWHQDEFGMYSFYACLPGEEGELVVKALEKMLDEIREDRTENVSRETVEQLEASQDNEDIKEHDGENVSRETQLAVADYKYPVGQATALARLAEHYLASDETNSLADKYQVLVHVNDNEAHIDHKIEQGPCCYLDDGRFLAPEVARQLACSASVTTVLEDDDGNVLNIGRRSRTPTRAISLAVQIRDGGCRYPGCCQKKWTDQHHIIHWADGGETSEGNLITLCRFHHTLLHKGEYRLQKEGNTIRFIDRFNRVVSRALYPQFPDSMPPEKAIRQADAECRKAGIVIDSTTADSRWDGGEMDYDQFIDVMYQLESSK